MWIIRDIIQKAKGRVVEVIWAFRDDGTELGMTKRVFKTEVQRKRGRSVPRKVWREDIMEGHEHPAGLCDCV